MGAVKRDANADFALGAAHRIADSVCKDCCADFVWNERKIYRCGSDGIVGAAFLDACGFGIAGGILHGFGQHAVVLAIAPAADGHVRICCGGREER